LQEKSELCVFLQVQRVSNSPAAKLGFFKTNLALEDPQQVFADNVPMNPVYQEPEWCQAGTIEHFEKMARFHGNRHQNMKN